MEQRTYEVVTLSDATHPADEITFELSHHYFEIVYGPVLGPTAVLLAHALGRRLEESDGTETEVDLRTVAHELGVRSGSIAEPVGGRSPLVRALDRLEHSRVVQFGGTTVALKRRVPPLGRRQLMTLPDRARAAHDRFVAEAVSEQTRSQGAVASQAMRGPDLNARGLGS